MTFLSCPSPTTIAKIIFLTFIFFLPISAGTLVYIPYYFLYACLFIIYGLTTHRIHPFSWLKHFRIHHPWILIFIAWWLISSSISLAQIMLIPDTATMHKFLASLRHITDIMMLLYVFAIARVVLLGQISHQEIFTAFMFGVVNLAFLQLLVYHFGPPPIEFIWGSYPPFGTQVRDLGTLASIACISAITLALRFTDLSPLKNSSLLIILLICFSYLIWLGGRASIGVTILTSLILIFLSRAYWQTSIKRISCIIVLIFFSGFIANTLSVFSFNGLNRVIAVSTPQITNTVKTEQTTEINSDLAEEKIQILEKVSSGRLSMWTVAIQAIKESPWLGYGPYGYVTIPKPIGYWRDDQPHNFLIQFLVEWGILGTIPMLGLLLYCAWYTLKQLPQYFKNQDTSFILCASIVFALTLDGLTSGTYFKIQSLLVLATAFSGLIFPRTYK